MDSSVILVPPITFVYQPSKLYPILVGTGNVPYFSFVETILEVEKSGLISPPFKSKLTFTFKRILSPIS